MTKEWNKKMKTDGPMRSMRDLVRLQKPVVERKGDKITKCFFLKETGQCFQDRCYWKATGKCNKYPKGEKDE